jgi:hypothetical protein
MNLKKSDDGRNPYCYGGRKVFVSGSGNDNPLQKQELATLDAMKTGTYTTYSPQSRATLLTDGTILVQIPIANGMEYRHFTDDSQIME